MIAKFLDNIKCFRPREHIFLATICYIFLLVLYKIIVKNSNMKMKANFSFFKNKNKAEKNELKAIKLFNINIFNRMVSSWI